MKRQKFYLIMRIICAVISALLVAGCVLVFVYLGTSAGFLTVMTTAVFLLLMMIFKFKHEDAQKKAEEEKAKKEMAAKDKPETTVPAENKPETTVPEEDKPEPPAENSDQ